VEDEIKSVFTDADVIALPSYGGMFNVEVDGKLIFSKEEAGRFPNVGEIVEILKTAGY
jgi:selenoprotein W-related protein